MDFKAVQKIVFTLFLLYSSVAYAQEWTAVSGLPDDLEARHHPITFSLEGYGYITTGSGESNSDLDDFARYDPINNSWTQLDPFPGGARSLGYAVTTGNRAYAGFGSSIDQSTGVDVYFNDLWEYNPETESWTELSSCPCAGRNHPALVAIEGKVYVGLGSNLNGDLDDWWEYDIASDTWDQKPIFPGGRRHHPYYFDIDNVPYVGLGHGGPIIYDDLYKYDPETEIWTEVASIPDQGRVAGTQFSYAGKGYVLSGDGNTHTFLPTGEFWEYDPELDSWRQLPAHPGSGRWAPGSFMIDGTVYFTCGLASNGLQKDLWAFDLGLMTSTSEEEINLDPFSVTPNPATDYIVLNGHSVSKPITLELYDAEGKSVLRKTMTNDRRVSLQSLTHGLYYYQIRSDNSLSSGKLIIK